MDTFSDKGFIPKGTSVSVDASGKYYVPPLTGFIPAREVSIANAQKGSLSQDSFDVTTGSFIPSGTSVYKLGSKYYVHPDTKDTPGREISGLGLSGSYLSKDVFDAKTGEFIPAGTEVYRHGSKYYIHPSIIGISKKEIISSSIYLSLKGGSSTVLKR